MICSKCKKTIKYGKYQWEGNEPVCNICKFGREVEI